MHVASHGLADSRIEQPAFTPARVRWTDIEFTASKFFLSATATLGIRAEPIADLARTLVEAPGTKPLLPASSAAKLHYTASGAGADADVTLWLDAKTGAALQTIQVSKGTHPRLRIDRYTPSGIYQITQRPAGDHENDLPPEKWTDRSEASKAYPEIVAGRPVLEPTSLLWLLAVSGLERKGDRIELLVYSHKHVNRVEVEVLGSRNARVDYRERAGSVERRRQGRSQLLRIRIAGTSVAPEPNQDNDFEMLGLRGDIELLLDPVTRVPVELRGRAKVIGEIALRIHSIRLTAPAP